MSVRCLLASLLLLSWSRPSDPGSAVAPLPRVELYTGVAPDRPADAVAWSPDGKLLATRWHDRLAAIWDPQTGLPQATLTHPGRILWQMAWSPDGSQLATAGPEAVALWSARTEKLVQCLEGA